MVKPVELIIEVKADTGDVAPGLAKLDKQLDEATKSAGKLDSELSDVSRHDVDIDVNDQAIKKARDRIDDLRDDIARMKSIDIDADTKQAEQDIAKLKKSIKALSDDSKSIDIGGGSGGGFHKLASDADEGIGHASERVGEFKDEARQNFGEITSSFAGSMDSITDLVQGTLGGLAGSMAGPIGLALGAVSVGVGLAVGQLQKTADKANEAQQAVIDLAAAIRDAGGDVSDLDWSQRFQDFADTIVDTKSWFEVWQDSSVTALDKAKDVADKTGVSFEDLFKGMAGDVPAAQRAIDQLNGKIAKQQEVVDDLTTAGVAYNSELGRSNSAQRDALHTLEGYRGELEESIGTTADAIKRNEEFADAMGMTVQQYQDQLDAAEKAKTAQEDAAAAAKAAADAYTQMVADIADPASVYDQLLKDQTDAEKLRAQGVADGTKDSSDSWEDYATNVTVSTQELIDEWNRQAEQTKAFSANLATIAAAGGQALADELRAKGPEVAGAVADLIAHASPEEQQAAIDAHANATGAAIGAGVASGITSQEDEVARAWAKLLAPFYVTPAAAKVPAFMPGYGQQSAPSGQAAGAGSQIAGGNVRVYIDGNQLRATVRTDVSAAAARAALAGSGARP
jgi:hypothetical protein